MYRYIISNWTSTDGLLSIDARSENMQFQTGKFKCCSELNWKAEAGDNIRKQGRCTYLHGISGLRGTTEDCLIAVAAINIVWEFSWRSRSQTD